MVKEQLPKVLSTAKAIAALKQEQKDISADIKSAMDALYEELDATDDKAQKKIVKRAVKDLINFLKEPVPAEEEVSQAGQIFDQCVKAERGE